MEPVAGDRFHRRARGPVVSEPRKTGFAGAWAHRRWRWLLASFAVSLTGDFLYFVALVVFLLDRTGSAGWVAGAAVVRILAYVVLGPLGGVIADRYDRRRLMMLLDGSRFVTMGAMAAVVWAEGPPIAVILLSVVNSAFTVPYRPAAVAATPLVVDEDDLAGANAAESVVGQIAFLLGPAVGAGLVAITTPGAALAVNAATFALSAVLISRAGDLGGGRRAATAAAPDGAERVSVLDDVREGVRIVSASAGLRALVILMGMLLMLVGVEQVVHVLVAERRLGIGANGVGLIDGATGLGGLLVAPFTVRLARARSSGLLLAAAGIVNGVPMAALALVSSTAPALVLMAIQGIGVISFEVLAITLMQRSCPEQALARVFSLNDSVTAGTQLIGSIAAPLLVAGPGLQASLWITGGAMVVVSLLVAPTLRRESVAADDERRRLAPMVERLSALGIFGDASQASLERLARAAVPRTFAAGTVVFREGDAPDDLHVVCSGELSVHVAGRGEVNRMAVDDWFGEIGLLRRVPRTATVQAETDVETWAIPGDVFVAALASGPDALPDPLRRTMTARLVRTHPVLAADATGVAA